MLDDYYICLFETKEEVRYICHPRQVFDWGAVFDWAAIESDWCKEVEESGEDGVVVVSSDKVRGMPPLGMPDSVVASD